MLVGSNIITAISSVEFRGPLSVVSLCTGYKSFTAIHLRPYIFLHAHFTNIKTSSVRCWKNPSLSLLLLAIQCSLHSLHKALVLHSLPA